MRQCLFGAASTGLMITSGFGWIANRPSMFKCCERKVVWILVPVLRTSGYFPGKAQVVTVGFPLGSIYSGNPGYTYSSSRVEKISNLPVGVRETGLSIFTKSSSFVFFIGSWCRWDWNFSTT